MKMIWGTNLEDKIEFAGDFKPVTLGYNAGMGQHTIIDYTGLVT